MEKIAEQRWCQADQSTWLCSLLFPLCAHCHATFVCTPGFPQGWPGAVEAQHNPRTSGLELLLVVPTSLPACAALLDSWAGDRKSPPNPLGSCSLNCSGLPLRQHSITSSHTPSFYYCPLPAGRQSQQRFSAYTGGSDSYGWPRRATRPFPKEGGGGECGCPRAFQPFVLGLVEAGNSWAQMGHKALERRGLGCFEVFGSASLFWEWPLGARLVWPGSKVLDWAPVCQRF